MWLRASAACSRYVPRNASTSPRTGASRRSRGGWPERSFARWRRERGSCAPDSGVDRRGLPSKSGGSSMKVLFEKKGPIAYVTINRPERLNACDFETYGRLAEVWREFRDDPEL